MRARAYIQNSTPNSTLTAWWVVSAGQSPSKSPAPAKNGPLFALTTELAIQCGSDCGGPLQT